MSNIHTRLVEDKHAYTRVKVPWTLDAEPGDYDYTLQRRPSRRTRLRRYLSAGGMLSFGRTVDDDVRELRQKRFLIIAGVLAVVWLVALIV